MKATSCGSDRPGSSPWKHPDTPIALGHAASIALVVLLFGALTLLVSPNTLRIVAPLGLIAYGLFLLIRARHPRWVGMQVAFRDLTLWSFLMATAHGAGLMFAPALIGVTAATNTDAYLGDAHARFADIVSHSLQTALAAVAVHTGSMLLVAGVIAIVVYRKFGLRFLRRGWVNLDAIWALSLLVVGAVMLSL